MDLSGSPNVTVADPANPAEGCELVCVLGGDGTILRGAEMSRGTGAPLLGVNLGHVGFLAESEREDLGATVERIVARDYAVEERMTLEVTVQHDGDLVYSNWALNEASVEKAARERMLELTVEIDGRPLSTWGCDGVVMATPTGSTAYAFSAGGPVVWPDVEAMLLVPISAHALFARPMVVGPSSTLPSRSSPTPWAPACCGATAAALSTCPRARASRWSVPPRPCGWPVDLLAVHRPPRGEVRPVDPRVERRSPPRAGRHRRRRTRLSRCPVVSPVCDSLARCSTRSGSRTSASSMTPSLSCTPA